MKKTKKKKYIVSLKNQKFKSLLIGSLLILLIAGLIFRLYIIQIQQHEYFKEKALRQHKSKYSIAPKRGKILDSKLRDLAISVPVFSVYAVPKQIIDLKLTVEKLADVLNLDPKNLEDKLIRFQENDKKFMWIQRKVDEEKILKLKERNLQGIYYDEESMRVYPGDELLSHVLGFVNIDNMGLEGIEKELNDYLSGKPGFRMTEKDAQGREIMSLRAQDIQKQDGYHVVLTIDAAIQTIAENQLKETVDKYQANHGSVIIMNPFSGDLLAMANYPTFNPNQFNQYNADQRRNRAITDLYEPGSTFKPLVASIAIDQGIIELSDVYDCEGGSFRIGRHTLHDAHEFNKLSVKEIIQKSSNIGMAKIGMQLNKDDFYQGLKLLGFGQKTNIQLPGESVGILREPKKWSKLSPSMIPMGHEVSVSPLQLITAYCTLANGGKKVHPKIVSKIIDSDLNKIIDNDQKEWTRIFQESTVKQMQEAMISVVSEDGTAKRASIEGYEVAGKTGTAQKINPEGGYSHSNYVASFIGFLPVESPEAVILVVIDSPQPVHYGGVVAAPAFKEIGEALMRYLEIPPHSIDINLSFSQGTKA